MKWFIFFSDDKFIIVKLMKMDSSECFISLTDLALALVFFLTSFFALRVPLCFPERLSSFYWQLFRSCLLPPWKEELVRIDAHITSLSGGSAGALLVCGRSSCFHWPQTRSANLSPRTVFERWSKGTLSARLSRQLGCRIWNREAEQPFRGHMHPLTLCILLRGASLFFFFVKHCTLLGVLAKMV